MSRIGNKPVSLSAGVKVTLQEQNIQVVGPKGKLSYTLPEIITATVASDVVKLERPDDSRQAKAQHGLARALVQNMVVGVTTGFKKDLEIRGVGYRAAVQGSKLNLSVGYSHPVEFVAPAGITITVPEPTKISVEGIDKQVVGQVAAIIRGYRKPEPYKGKGIRYVGEVVAMKEGKKVGK